MAFPCGDANRTLTEIGRNGWLILRTQRGGGDPHQVPPRPGGTLVKDHPAPGRRSRCPVYVTKKEGYDVAFLYAWAGRMRTGA